MDPRYTEQKTDSTTYSSWVAGLDGGEYDPMGWVDGHFVQLGYQIAGTCAAFAWSFVLTCLILFLLNLVPGLSLRASLEEEEIGMDDYQLGEFAYDYVEVTRHVSDLAESASTSEVPSDVRAEKTATTTV
jgi:ammonium transporter, Amt family